MDKVPGMDKIMSDQPWHDPPHSSEPYDRGGFDDLGALSTDQQQKLNVFKVKTRIENEKYLRDHPELECLLTSFLREAVRHKPENVRDFAADFFTNPELPKSIEKMLVERQKQMKVNQIVMKV